MPDMLNLSPRCTQAQGQRVGRSGQAPLAEVLVQSWQHPAIFMVGLAAKPTRATCEGLQSRSSDLREPAHSPPVHGSGVSSAPTASICIRPVNRLTRRHAACECGVPKIL